MVSRLLIQLRLNGIEQGSINDRGLFAPEDFPLEGDLSDVEPIAKQVGEEVSVGWFRLIVAIRTGFSRWRCDARAMFKPT